MQQQNDIKFYVSEEVLEILFDFLKTEKNIIDELEGRPVPAHTPQKRLEIYSKLIEENVAYYGERIGINRSRKTAGYWINGFPNASAVRGEFVRLDTIEEVRKLFSTVFEV